MMEIGENETEKYEELLEEYKSVFHQNHFQVTSILKSGVQLTCLIDSIQILLMKKYLSESIKGHLTLDQIKVKISLLKDYIKVFEVIDEGITR